MEDHEAMQFLQMLRRYVLEYKPDIPQTISALADDLASSMDVDYVSYDQAREWADEIKQTEGVS